MRREPPSSGSSVERLPLTEARVHLGALVRRVHLGKKYVILEKDGIPVVGVMDIAEFEDYLELRDPSVRAHIRKSREEILAGRHRAARDLLGEIRAGKRGKKAAPRGRLRGA